jgi:hypothetical protein
MENKQTAVQILFEDLCHLGYIEYPDEILVQDRLNLALELEKQQIIQTYKIAQVNVMINSTVRSEQYYYETYKNPKQ